MVPTNFLGAVYYLAFLVPGFLYMIGRERHGPERKLDAFRQATNVVFASVISELAALALFSWLWLPLFDERKLLTDTATYWTDDPIPLLGFYLVGLTLASCLAYMASLPRARHGFNKILDHLTFPAFRIGDRESVHPSVTSAWWRLFHHSPEESLKNYDNEDKKNSWWKFWKWFRKPERQQTSVLTRALLVLENGTQVEGYIDAFNSNSNDIPDRDLILRHPILRRTGEPAEWVELPSEYACFARSSIVEMYVRYYGASESEEDGGSSDA